MHETLLDITNELYKNTMTNHFLDIQEKIKQLNSLNDIIGGQQ